MLLLAIGLWDARGTDPATPAATGADGAPPTSARAFGNLRLPVPRSWQELERTEGQVTWGTPGRTHTVTLAATQATSEPLVAVVREVARQSTRELPNAVLAAGPTIIDAGAGAARGDAVVAVEFRVEQATRSVRIVQVWRRDSRTSTDAVATWSTSDATWQVEPRTNLPTIVG
jgi:hypothetical protein